MAAAISALQRGRLGLFARILAAVFSATAEPIAASRGEIYQYVGDEIVVTWTESEGIPEARPLRCFFLMEESLNQLKENFREQFSPCRDCAPRCTWAT